MRDTLHAVGQQRQRVAKIDHLVQTVAEKLSLMVLPSKNPRKQPTLNIYLRALTIRIHPTSPAFTGVAEVLQGRLGYGRSR